MALYELYCDSNTLDSRSNTNQSMNENNSYLYEVDRETSLNADVMRRKLAEAKQRNNKKLPEIVEPHQ